MRNELGEKMEFHFINFTRSYSYITELFLIPSSIPIPNPLMALLLFIDPVTPQPPGSSYLCLLLTQGSIFSSDPQSSSHWRKLGRFSSCAEAQFSGPILYHKRNLICLLKCIFTYPSSLSKFFSSLSAQTALGCFPM